MKLGLCFLRRGLVIAPEGFPLAYEVLEGNTSDPTTLRDFLERIEQSYGQARRRNWERERWLWLRA